MQGYTVVVDDVVADHAVAAALLELDAIPLALLVEAGVLEDRLS